MYGSHYLKGWSKTQATRALSSAETDTIVKGCVLCDASAALGIVRRKVLGRQDM